MSVMKRLYEQRMFGKRPKDEFERAFERMERRLKQTKSKPKKLKKAS